MKKPNMVVVEWLMHVSELQETFMAEAGEKQLAASKEDIGTGRKKYPTQREWKSPEMG